jgi:hypothetical protein
MGLDSDGVADTVSDSRGYPAPGHLLRRCSIGVGDLLTSDAPYDSSSLSVARSAPEEHGLRRPQHPIEMISRLANARSGPDLATKWLTPVGNSDGQTSPRHA